MSFAAGKGSLLQRKTHLPGANRERCLPTPACRDEKVVPFSSLLLSYSYFPLDLNLKFKTFDNRVPFFVFLPPSLRRKSMKRRMPRGPTAAFHIVHISAFIGFQHILKLFQLRVGRPFGFREFQHPFCFAISIFALPKSVISPCDSSLSARLLFFSDQLLVLLRCLKYLI